MGRLAAAAAIVVVVVVVVVVMISARPAVSPPSAGGATTSSGREVDRGAFRVGTCMAFAPTAGDRGKTVFLDAGHGGIDPGAIGTTMTGQTVGEADETLPVELDTMALLRAKGFRVVVSRTGASTVVPLTAPDISGGVLSLRGAHDDVVARDLCANAARADILVGIYFDAGGSARDAGSLTAYDPDRPFAGANLKLARLLQSAVLSAMNARGWAIPDDGAVPDTSLGSLAGNPADGGIAGQAATYGHLLLIGPAAAGYFSTPSQMPGAVVEPLYITDPFEASIAASAHGQKVIAQGIATAVERYFQPTGGKART